jgi:hypothetical protein
MKHHVTRSACMRLSHRNMHREIADAVCHVFHLAAPWADVDYGAPTFSRLWTHYNIVSYFAFIAWCIVTSGMPCLRELPLNKAVP